MPGYSSCLTEITSGVPQGSILGPLFFALFIYDLPGVVCSTGTIALYAGDSKMFRVINCNDDQMLFLNDVDKLYHWSLRYGELMLTRPRLRSLIEPGVTFH